MSAALLEKTELPFSATTPISIARVGLKARDADALAAYYRNLLGFEELRRSGNRIALGAGGRELLEIEGSAALKPDDPRSAGLYHTAFLFPSRADLARWTQSAIDRKIGIDGASDHLVSEAIYLDDPEGNGIEIYRDRERSEWTYAPDGTVKMATHRLDLQALYEEAPKEGWTGQENGTVIGHIHLQVSDIPQADAFFRDVLGLDIMARYPGASFFATGKYHHHVAANVWNSRGQPKRQDGMSGLSDYTIRFNDPAKLEAAVKALDAQAIATTRSGDTVSLVDPWGIGLRLST